MTVIRLAGGGLLLHSPIRPSAELVEEVRGLGRVVAIVAPNRLHHLFVGAWLALHPEADLFVAPGLETKRSDLCIRGVLAEQPESLWKGSLEQTLVRGMPWVNEVVFFHPSTRTLVASDLAFHIGPQHPPATRLLAWVSSAYGRLAPTITERLLIRDRDAMRASLDRILQWPFDRVIIAHGSVVETGGHRLLEQGYAWLLASR